jgi:hypothetical protein
MIGQTISTWSRKSIARSNTVTSQKVSAGVYVAKLQNGTLSKKIIIPSG